MGEANRRGSFEQRQALAIEKNKRRKAEDEEAELARRNAMTDEERKKEADVRTKLATLAMFVGSSLPNGL